MKNTLTLLLIFAASLVWGQAAIEGGGGVCHVSGNPNDVAVLDVQDVRAECFLVVDTTSGALYVYDPTGTIGSRWVIFSGSDGNGIITALPAGNVSIDAAGNQLIIEDAGMYQLQQRSMLEDLANVGVGQQDLATTFGRIYEPGFNTPSTAWFEGLKTGRLHTGIDPWTPNYRVGTWGSLSSGDYAYSGFRWETDTSLYRIRIYAEGNSTAVFRGLEYESDLSANFVDRSLVDKGYVDSRPDADGIYSGSGSLPSDVVVSKAGHSLILSDVSVNGEPFMVLDDSTIFKLPSSSAIEFRSDGELIGNIRYVGSTDRFEFAGQDILFGQTGPNGGRMGLFSPGLADYEILKTDSSLTLNSSTGRVYARKGAGGTVAYPTERPSVASVWQYNADGTGEMVDVSTLGGGGGDPLLIDDETLHTTTQTALAGEVVLIDCSGGAVTVNPPASPTKNMKFYVSDAAKSAGTNTITIDFTTASQPLCGSVENYLIQNDGAFAGFVYVNSTTGWIPLNR